MTARATATIMATDSEQVIDQYITAWNERDRLCNTPGADRPHMDGTGHDGIDDMIGGVQTEFLGYRFRRTGELDAHHDRV